LSFGEIFKKNTMPAKQRGIEMKDAVPGKVVNALGDGNCFYRAISHAITGSEDSHMKLRKNLAKYSLYMSTNSAEKLTHWTSNPKYVTENRVGYSGVWVTTTDSILLVTMLLAVVKVGRH